MRIWRRKFTTLFFLLAFLPIVALASNALGQEPKSNPLWSKIDRLSSEVEAQCIAWRRDIHQHPELGNREFRTSKLVADHLRKLGMEVKTEVAHTGVVGILRGKQETPVVALRADMDALPVTEAVDVPFASKVKAQYEGKEVGVMHACGHDNHTAILMAVAEVLSKLKEELPGTVKFIFQPAEEGGPKGEEWGASLMVREGVLESPKPDAIFALHVGVCPAPTGTISYRPAGIMAGVDRLGIVIKGTQTHGALPWMGIDPVVVASQVVMGLQTIVSRQTNLTVTPVVISVGTFNAGTRWNIIPDKVEMGGTIRVFDSKIQKEIQERIQKTAKMIAESAGASAEVTIDSMVPVTYNDPDLTSQMIPTLERVAGRGKVSLVPATTVGEDFSYFSEKVPGLFFFLGITPEGGKWVPNHSPYFYVDERALIVGIRALANLTVDYMANK
jgi:amidohydrolase